MGSSLHYSWFVKFLLFTVTVDGLFDWDISQLGSISANTCFSAKGHSMEIGRWQVLFLTSWVLDIQGNVYIVLWTWLQRYKHKQSLFPGRKVLGEAAHSSFFLCAHVIWIYAIFLRIILIGASLTCIPKKPCLWMNVELIILAWLKMSWLKGDCIFSFWRINHWTLHIVMAPVLCNIAFMAGMFPLIYRFLLGFKMAYSFTAIMQRSLEWRSHKMNSHKCLDASNLSRQMILIQEIITIVPTFLIHTL